MNIAQESLIDGSIRHIEKRVAVAVEIEQGAGFALQGMAMKASAKSAISALRAYMDSTTCSSVKPLWGDFLLYEGPGHNTDRSFTLAQAGIGDPTRRNIIPVSPGCGFPESVWIRMP